MNGMEGEGVNWRKGVWSQGWDVEMCCRLQGEAKTDRKGMIGMEREEGKEDWKGRRSMAGLLSPGVGGGGVGVFPIVSFHFTCIAANFSHFCFC